MWPGRPGHVAPDGPDMWPGHGAPDSPDMGPGQPGHVARTARTCGPDGPDAARIMASARVDMFALGGRGGFGWLSFEEVLGAFMAFFCFSGGGGGGRWLMYEEMLGSFILSLGSPG